MMQLLSVALPLLLLLAACIVARPALASDQAGKLQSYGIYYNSTTVSGLSAGAYFAVQFHVAFSANIIGAGIVAGGPYFCAQNSVAVATVNCMTTPMLISVPALVWETKNTIDIDNVENLANSRVFIFSGSKDTVVNPGVAKKLEEWYEAFIPDRSRIATEYSVPSEHSWTTVDYGNSCNYLGTPYINKCGYPTAERLMSWIAGRHGSTEHVPSNLFEFDQSEFYISAGSMDSIGYVYVPTNCQDEETTCTLHISFHGCLQGRDSILSIFALHTDLLPIAEANDVIILFPQVKKSSVLPLNPDGCFDWWGYSGIGYATRRGTQMAAVRKMMNRIAGLD